MKPFLLLLFSLNCIYAVSQIETDLEKYSYIAIATHYSKDSSKIKGNGTGFFIQIEKRLFFITNYHVYSGYDPFSDTQLVEIDNINIRIPLNNTFMYLSKGVSRDTIIERKIKSYDIGDLVVFEIPGIADSLRKEMKLFQVNGLINPALFDEKPDSIFISGFPVSLQADYKKNPIRKNILAPYKYLPIKGIDSAGKILARKAENIMTTCANLTIEKGMSGSPVWGIYHQNGNREVSLLGVAFASQLGSKGSGFVKSIEIIKWLQRL